MGIRENIAELRQKFETELSAVRDSDAVEKIRVAYLGKKGSVTELLKGLKDLSGAEKKEFGQMINLLKREVDEKITAQVEAIRKAEEDRLVNSAEQYDVTLPAETDFGSYHPITLVQRELEEIFASMGFTVEDYKEIVKRSGAVFKEREMPHMTGEDFAFYQKKWPGVFAFLGVGLVPALHNNRFDFDEKALKYGIDNFVALLDYYNEK